jgi:hypothetical protein
MSELSKLKESLELTYEQYIAFPDDLSYSRWLDAGDALEERLKGDTQTVLMEMPDGLGPGSILRTSTTYHPVSKPAHYNNTDGGVESDGGPSSYYDFPVDWKTWNDFADYKATKQWKEHSFHLGNVGKVLCRWGDKAGTTKSYDARKLIYSGLRVLLMLEGGQNVRSYLESLLEDPQFKPR